MIGFARKHVLRPGEIGVYHCQARCVRQAFLCGVDSKTGKNYGHRRALLEDRMKRFAKEFAIDVLTDAVMSNHLHTVLRTRPDIAETWTDEEVARRWCTICALARNLEGEFTGPKPQRVKRLLADEKKLARARRRLSKVSWFMGKICEWMARFANKEEDTRGHFWEGRFRCDALLDEEAILACSMYVDLNPVRAMMAQTPEESRFTSAYDRIRARQAKLTQAMGVDVPVEDLEADLWLSPLTLEETTSSESPGQRKGFLHMSLDEYLQLLDQTGRRLRDGKRGAIPADLAPILDRLQINTDNWVDTVKNFGNRFRHFIGTPEHLEGLAKKVGKRWVQRIARSRAAFERSPAETESPGH